MRNTLTDILQITETGKFNGVNARNLHQALQVGRDFSTWIKSRLNGANFIEEQDFIVVQNLSSPKLGNANNELSPMARPQKTNDYFLSIDTAKHICLMEKNEIGQAIRQHFINAEKALKKYAPNVYRNNLQKTKERLASIDYNHVMKKALEKHLFRQGKQPQPKYFINEENLLNSLVIGGSIKQWKQANGIQGKVRDYFNDEQLSLLTELEKTNTALLELDVDYSTRKKQLTALAHRLLETSITVTLP
ncbi:antA/AntB antirepressor family protein [Mannheimia sp. AT1]|uniref:AntA/AntB antirepressor family protein n=1 Tax=Mannheimia cairinae TaxID=3025936 RepID=A0ABT5MLN2_9PAST|nr:antA/AntB antirepressor family protein [Mannheimia cairinae]MDD0823109.1 antA/AntB antirepressor family protein [Mannheimia cairinae]MDD0825866.1 antA/AntB antirepressor family protein [Mannheimia cairinae]